MAGWDRLGSLQTWVVTDNMLANNGWEVDLQTMDGKFMIIHVWVDPYQPHFPVRNIEMFCLQ
jgi:hypothetical protein